MAPQKARKTKKRTRSNPPQKNRKSTTLFSNLSAQSGTAAARLESSESARVVLLTVDPYLIHAYWTLSVANVTIAGLQLGEDSEGAEAVLRFHDVSPQVFDGSRTTNFFDVPVQLDVKNWYVHLRSPEKSYYADLGLRTNDGRFFPLARSNVTDTPRDNLSNRKAAVFMLVEGNYERVEQIIVAESPARKEATIHERTRDVRKKIFTGSFVAPAESKPAPVDITEMSERNFIPGLSSISLSPSKKTIK